MAPWYPEDILSRNEAKYRGEIHPKRHACTLVGLRSWVRHFCAWIFVGWLCCLFCFVCLVCEVWGGVFGFCCLNYDSWEVWYALDLSVQHASWHWWFGGQLEGKETTNIQVSPLKQLAKCLNEALSSTNLYLLSESNLNSRTLT